MHTTLSLSLSPSVCLSVCLSLSLCRAVCLLLTYILDLSSFFFFVAFRKWRRIWTSHKINQIFGRASSFTHSRAVKGMIFLNNCA